MFAKHQPIIAAHASTPEGFLRVITFVLVTIREPLHRAPKLLARVEAGDMVPLWGFKLDAYRWWQNHAAEMLADCKALNGDTDAILALLALCPGLGLTKAGFVAQLCWGISGCLDRHNLKRWGIDENITKMGPVKPATALKRAKVYNAIVAEHGGTEGLWDSWCEFVAGNKNSEISGGAERVSQLHCEALGLA